MVVIMKKIIVLFVLFSFLISCSGTKEVSSNKKFISKFSKANEYYVATEKMPVPVDGIGSIQNKVIAPEVVKEENIDGMVYVNAYINENGTVDFVEIVKSLNPDCDNEALRVVKDSKFIPGYHMGKAIKMVITVPIVFR